MLTETLKDYQIILASNSPRRQELLKKLNLHFTVKVFDVKETYSKNLQAESIALHIAHLKSQPFKNILKKNEIVITSDTIVWAKNKVFGKPICKESAAKTLQELSGNTHQVITGVCVRSKYKKITFSDTTEVTFGTLSNEEIYHYVDHYKPYDKAGSYGIQEWIGMVGIEKIKGNYHNVIGLPIYKLYKLLKNPKIFFSKHLK